MKIAIAKEGSTTKYFVFEDHQTDKYIKATFAQHNINVKNYNQKIVNIKKKFAVDREKFKKNLPKHESEKEWIFKVPGNLQNEYDLLVASLDTASEFMKNAIEARINVIKSKGKKEMVINRETQQERCRLIAEYDRKIEETTDEETLKILKSEPLQNLQLSSIIQADMFPNLDEVSFPD